MTLTETWEPRVSRKLCGGVLSAVLHVVLLLVVLSGGRQYLIREGDAPISAILLLAERELDRSEIVEVPLPGPPVPLPSNDEQLRAAIVHLAPPPALDTIAPQPEDFASRDAVDEIELSLPSPGEVPATVAMSEAEKAALTKRLERLAADTSEAHRREVSWEQDGRQYSAVLVREKASDGSALEQVIADVSTSDRGKDLTTRVNLRRLAFSQFTQMVDTWDPMVQLHDDEIVGRFHSNSQIKLLHDASTAPTFSGKVTTAARGFDVESRTRRPRASYFQAGIETRAGRIEMPASLQPFEWAPRDEHARVYEFAGDTHIRFYRDGSFTSQPRGAAETQYVAASPGVPLYVVAASGATLHVQGTVSGRVLVYSPHKIVIEGSLTYARDPRQHPDSGDYAGLVSGKYVEVASPRVTGPGDLEIDAAIFAGGRFVVSHYNHPRGAILRIFGSLSAGSLSATEPRYATKVEYDRRFERQRPPGFPSTDRYEAADWNGNWVETPGPAVGGPS